MALLLALTGFRHLIDGYARLFRNREGRELAETPRTASRCIGDGSRRRSHLRRAAVRVAGTGLAGKPRQIGIAAYRDRFLQPLRNIRQSDMITVNTSSGEYRYRVVSTKVADPSDVSALESDGRENLTLVTCFPFYFIGAALNGSSLRAERVT